MTSEVHDPNYRRGHKNEACDDSGPPLPQTGKIHMLITGLDYECDKVSWAAHGGQRPLDHKHSFAAMKEIAELSGADTLECLFNNQVTKAGVLAAIGRVGKMCGPGDTFIFYFCGHGDQLPSLSGESSGMDQCLCTVDEQGRAGTSMGRDLEFEKAYWLRDDELAKTILAAVRPEAKILVLIDFCHSETICDFTEDSEWAKQKRKAISICAAQDKEVALSDHMQGGIFTNSIAEALMELQQQDTFNVSTLYNKIQYEYKVNGDPNNPQHISIHGCVVRPQQFPWPLQIKRANKQYVSYKRRRFGQGGMPAPAFQSYAAPVSYAAPGISYAAPITYAAPASYSFVATPGGVTYAAPTIKETIKIEETITVDKKKKKSKKNKKSGCC
jgi:hypothetical protein